MAALPSNLHWQNDMIHSLFLIALLLATTDSTDWPAWRGPHGDGTAEAQINLPTEWSANHNIAWRTPIPGRGHASATIIGSRVFLPTAVDQPQQQMVICFDRQDGHQLWKTIVHDGGFANSGGSGNDKASLASSTIASDGENLFVNFLNDNAVHTTSLTLDGRIRWQTKVCDYILHQGYGSSPLIYKQFVIAAADNKGGGAVVAMDRETGTVAWRHSRPNSPNYASPVVVTIDGQDQLIMTGCDLVESLDPNTGKLLWRVDGATTECVSSTPSVGPLVFSSGGYPKNHLAAYNAQKNGELQWEQKIRLYVPSLIAHQQNLYAVMDEGIAVCIRARDGKTLWKKRLGGTFSSSPVLVGQTIYATNEDGKTFVFKADSEKFSGISENELGTSVFATPAISGNSIFLRVAEYQNGQRKESLIRIGK